MEDILNIARFTGTQVNYYFICHRKLWYFSRYISMESNSDMVLTGKILHNDSYKRNKKEYNIDDKIVIDFIEREGIISEIKKSNKMEEAHVFQMLYYLYYMKQKGLSNLKGIIHYPLLKQKAEVFLTSEKEEELLEMLNKINDIVKSENIPGVNKKIVCKKCSYYELCWV